MLLSVPIFTYVICLNHVEHKPCQTMWVCGSEQKTCNWIDSSVLFKLSSTMFFIAWGMHFLALPQSLMDLDENFGDGVYFVSRRIITAPSLREVVFRILNTTLMCQSIVIYLCILISPDAQTVEWRFFPIAEACSGVIVAMIQTGSRIVHFYDINFRQPTALALHGSHLHEKHAD